MTEHNETTGVAVDRYWTDVDATVDARARPAVPEEVDEGEIADEWILDIDGDRELVTYDELTSRVTFEDEYQEKTIEIPIRDLVEAYQYEPHQEYNWVGDDTLKATVEYDPARQVVMSMDFDTGDGHGLTFEVLSELGADL